MTATEELRRLLDERGVEYYETTTIGGVNIYLDWVEACGSYTAYVGVKGADCYAGREYLTPEQAVEAALGPFASDEEKRDFEAFRDGEWVEASVYRSLKAQYDELEATLGRGKCRNTSYRLDESRFHCSECGFGCWVKDVADGRDKLPQYCPRCGKEVEE